MESTDPKVIEAGEPTSDVNPVHSIHLDSVVDELETSYQMSIVITPHDMDLAVRFANRTRVLAEGHVISEGKPSEKLIEMLSRILEVPDRKSRT